MIIVHHALISHHAIEECPSSYGAVHCGTFYRGGKMCFPLEFYYYHILFQFTMHLSSVLVFCIWCELPWVFHYSRVGMGATAVTVWGTSRGLSPYQGGQGGLLKGQGGPQSTLLVSSLQQKAPICVQKRTICGFFCTFAKLCSSIGGLILCGS